MQAQDECNISSPPSPQPKNRSTFVTVLAWIFIVVAGFSTVVGIMQNIMIHTIFTADKMKDMLTQGPGVDQIPVVARFMFEHLSVFAFSILMMSVFALASSIGLLLRQNWARIMFIVLMGLGIVWELVGTVLQFTMSSTTPVMPEELGDQFSKSFHVMQTVMMVVGFIITVGLIVLFGWIIKRLTSDKIKAEFGD